MAGDCCLRVQSVVVARQAARDPAVVGEQAGVAALVEDADQGEERAFSIDAHAATAALAFVDADRIGVLGVCAGGGYAVHAALTDHRIKAVGGVSSVNIGDMFRRGWRNDQDPASAIGLLEAGAAQRSAEARGGEIAYIPFSPTSLEGVEEPDMREAYDYYRTPRARHPNTPSQFTSRSLVQLASYDAFHLADVLLTQPLQLVAGSQAGSLWFSQDLLARAASAQKGLHVVEDATHMSLYDTPAQMDEAMSKLAPFYKAHL